LLKWTRRKVSGLWWIRQGCRISNSYGVSLGKNFATNRNVLIDAIGGIEVGDNTGIGPNCVVLSHEHSMLAQGNYAREESYKRKPIKNRSGVWVSSNCFIQARLRIRGNALPCAS